MSDKRPTEAPATLTRLLERCVALDASDIHLAEGLAPYLRAQGPLEVVPDEAAIDGGEMAAIVDHLHAGFSSSDAGSVDGAFTAADGTRYRYNAYRRSGGLALALRRLEDRFRDLADLGLPDSLYKLCNLPYGLVLVSVPTGRGKTTTLATLIDRINNAHACHVITIEDPIEFIHTNIESIISQREVPTHCATFPSALDAALREDPDVIVVG
ncbi:MAG: ATPase, T2SS/T4P/T4SS family, partial [Pseudomonadota bacterium]